MRRVGVASAAFVLLATAVNVGATRPIDRFAHRHLQPLAGGNGHPRLRELTDVLLVPFAPAVAAAIIVCLAYLAYRRAGMRTALVWPVALAAGFAVELACKVTVQQDGNHSWRALTWSIDSSYPSGHALRAVLLAFAVAWLWPRSRALVAPALLLVTVILVANGWHSPTDVAGGLLAGLPIAWLALWLAESESASLTRTTLRLADVRPRARSPASAPRHREMPARPSQVGLPATRVTWRGAC